MESANLHHDHHHLQEQLQLVYASVLPSSNYYGVGLASTHSLSPNFSFRNTVYQNGVNSDGIRDSRLEKNVEIDQLIRPPGPPPLDHHHPVTTNTNTMVQDLNFEWANHNLHDHEHDSHDSGFNINDHHHLLYLARIKQEENSMSEHNINSLIPITDFEDNLQFLYSMSSSCHQDSKNNGHEQIRDSLNEDEDEDHDHHHMGMSYIRGQFSQIYPSVNISNGNYYKQLSSSASSPPMISTSQLDHRSDQINLASASARFNDHRHHQSLISHSQYHHNDRLQQSSLSCSTTDHTTNAQASIASFNNKVAEGKRNSNLMERKPPQTGPKKSRLESRSSCPPFKVRKEKLGDRIAALQQLVAPFGKTDTASVLMEAIGYIKFLQNQVETLSVPYMKSSRNSRNYETIPNAGPFENGNEEPKRDLRSRGLCLVPLTCMSYVTGDYGEDSGGNNTTGIWPPPNFLGGTC